MTTATAAVQLVVALVTARPGLTIYEIAGASGRGLAYLRNVLSFCVGAGLLGYAQSGRRAHWYTPPLAAAVREELAARKAALLKPRRVRVAEPDDLPAMPVRRHVDCRAPLPFVCTAPSSVFALAADGIHRGVSA